MKLIYFRIVVVKEILYWVVYLLRMLRVMCLFFIWFWKLLIGMSRYEVNKLVLCLIVFVVILSVVFCE